MHTTGAITNYIDVAQLTLYAFWIFFAGLIIYLILESKREGFPMITNRAGERPNGILPLPTPKIFKLRNGQTKAVPWAEPLDVLNVRPTSPWEGAPYEPLGNPMIDGLGPAAYTLRDPHPELDYHGHHRTVPMRIASDHWVAPEDPDPRGMDVIACDGLVAGTVADLWVDRTELLCRFVEVALPDPLARHVLVPMELVQVAVHARGGVVKVVSVTAEMFKTAPVTESPDAITSREEDRIAAYFASGHLYATPSRMGPLI
jgi:photosynthetic reaction center H subunit